MLTVFAPLALSLAVAPSPPPAPPDLLSGPQLDPLDERATLVQRSFDGALVPLERPADIAAVEQLDLSESQRAAFDRAVASHQIAFDTAVFAHYGTIVELGALSPRDEPLAFLTKLGELQLGFGELSRSDPIARVMRPYFTEQQHATVESLLDEYQAAVIAEYRRRDEPGAGDLQLRIRARLDQFGVQIRQAIERRASFAQAEFDDFIERYGLTQEQSRQAQAILQPIALAELQGTVTQTQRQAAFDELREILTARQVTRIVIDLAANAGRDLIDRVRTPDPPGPYKPDAGPHEVETWTEEWRDDARWRDIPVRFYAPSGLNTPAPVIVFSHGYGGTRDGYQYLGEHWASHGYIVVHPQHAGSDRDSITGGRGRLRDRMERGLSDESNLINRPLDVSFVLDQVERAAQNQVHRLHGRVDMEHVGVGGHSFGAYTTMAVCGTTIDLANKQDRSFRDERVDAGLAMSSQGPGRLGLDDESWASIALPMFYMTGTRDFEMGSRSIAGRLAGFDLASTEDQLLLVLDDAQHLAFSDRRAGLLGDDRRDPAHHRLILMAGTAFWDAYLRGDENAALFLASDALTDLADDAGMYLRK